MPKVRFGEPETKSSFDLHEKGSAKIFIAKGLELKGDDLRIQLNSFLIFKTLEVHGFKIL